MEKIKYEIRKWKEDPCKPPIWYVSTYVWMVADACYYLKSKKKFNSEQEAQDYINQRKEVN